MTDDIRIWFQLYEARRALTRARLWIVTLAAVAAAGWFLALWRI